MRARGTLILVLAVVATTGGLAAVAQDHAAAIRFATVEVYIDTGDRALAAYQFELRDTAGVTKIVGIEGDAGLPFQDPPFYDPAALRSDRVIVAAYSAADPQHHPAGRTRVARIHVAIEGDRVPQYELRLTAAATADGRAIDAHISHASGSTP